MAIDINRPQTTGRIFYNLVMASTKEYRDFILEQTRSLNVTSKPMMGEYLLYYEGLLLGDRNGKAETYVLAGH